MTSSQFEWAVRRWDVLAFLRSYGHDPNVTQSQQAQIKCPACHDDEPRFRISLQTKLWICFHGRCQRTGHAVSLVELIAGLSPKDAARLIMEQAREGGAITGPFRRGKTPAIALPPNFHLLQLPATSRSQPYWDYLDERGLAPSLILQYGMGYCRVGQYQQRVIIPVHMGGELRGWAARAIGEAHRKYLYPEIKVGNLLFNIDAVTGRREIVLTEGIFDCLRLPNEAVSTLGNKLSAQQLDILIVVGVERLVVCYDGDAAGRQAALTVAEEVPEHIDVAVACLPDDADPGSVPLTTLLKAIREAEPISAGSYGRLIRRA